jgi:regulator of replication initiation timing
MALYAKSQLSERYARLEKRYNVLLKEKETLCKEVNALKVRSNAFETDLNALLDQLDEVMVSRDTFQKENIVLKQENEALRCKLNNNPTPAVVSSMIRDESFAEKVKKHGQRKHCKKPSTRVYDASNEKDVDFIMRTCCGKGGERCMLSDNYVNKHYSKIIPNNGYHNGVSNACLAISLSDGLSRIVNGRSANSQEKDEMIKALGCKGEMIDMSDLDVLVAVFNRICTPFSINIHVFERKSNGFHTHHQTIAHSPNADTTDKCIVLSWIPYTHFELMVKT